LKHFASGDSGDAVANSPKGSSSWQTQTMNCSRKTLLTLGKYRTIRIDLHYRALAVEIPEGSLWFWIGSHAEYDKVLG
jgi:hypothetical protein